MRRLGLAALLAATLTACGGDETEPGASGGAAMPTTPVKRSGPVPDGWTIKATRYFSFAHPADWTVTQDAVPGDTPGEVVFEVRGRETTPGLPPDVIVGATPRYTSGLEGLLTVNDADAQVRFRDRRVIKEEKPDVPGAIGARLIEADTPNKAPDGAVSTVRQFDLVALSESNTAVNLFVQVPAGEAESSRVREVVKTLEVR